MCSNFISHHQRSLRYFPQHSKCFHGKIKNLLTRFIVNIYRCSRWGERHWLNSLELDGQLRVRAWLPVILIFMIGRAYLFGLLIILISIFSFFVNREQFGMYYENFTDLAKPRPSTTTLDSSRRTDLSQKKSAIRQPFIDFENLILHYSSFMCNR